MGAVEPPHEPANDHDSPFTQDASGLAVPALVSDVRSLLGVRLVAYLGRLDNVRTVGEWADAVATPDTDVVARLRWAHRVTLVLTATDDKTVAQSWWQGHNPHLDDAAPARLLREGDPAIEGPRILDAATAFATGF